MGVNPFIQSTAVGKGMGSLGSSEFSMAELREFKAGGSSAATVNPIGASAHGEEQNLEIGKGCSKQMEAELMGVDGGEDGMESIPSSNLARPPLMEMVNQVNQSPLEHVVVHFSSCTLK